MEWKRNASHAGVSGKICVFLNFTASVHPQGRGRWGETYWRTLLTKDNLMCESHYLYLLAKQEWEGRPVTIEANGWLPETSIRAAAARGRMESACFKSWKWIWRYVNSPAWSGTHACHKLRTFRTTVPCVLVPMFWHLKKWKANAQIGHATKLPSPHLPQKPS